METIETIKRNMAQACGTSQYIKHVSEQLVFTDGINQLRQDADAFWLVDAIASYQYRFSGIQFQLWELKVKDNSAVLTMKEDSGCPELVHQEIEYTDFPLDEIKLYVESGGYGTIDNWTPCLVLLLPSEH